MLVVVFVAVVGFVVMMVLLLAIVVVDVGGDAMFGIDAGDADASVC